MMNQYFSSSSLVIKSANLEAWVLTLSVCGAVLPDSHHALSMIYSGQSQTPSNRREKPKKQRREEQYKTTWKSFYSIFTMGVNCEETFF